MTGEPVSIISDLWCIVEACHHNIKRTQKSYLKCFPVGILSRPLWGTYDPVPSPDLVDILPYLRDC